MGIKSAIQNIEFFLSLPFNIKKDIWTLKENLNKTCLKRTYDLKLIMSNSYIGDTAHFENKPIFPHGLSCIHISGDAVIGKNAVIFQGVTIGSNMIAESKKSGAPTIGDNCYIGAGAKIIGGITVGNNCRIGANAVVFKDVPDNCTVTIGGGMRIIQHDSLLDNRFITKDKDGNLIYWENEKWRKLTQ